MSLPWHHCRCQPCLRGCAQLPRCASDFFPPLASHQLSPTNKTHQKYSFSCLIIIAHPIDLSCELLSRRDQVSQVHPGFSLGACSEIRNFLTSTFRTQKSPIYTSFSSFNFSNGFTLLTAPPQGVPGTLVGEEPGLLGTAVPYLRSTAASEYFTQLLAFLQKQII